MSISSVPQDYSITSSNTIDTITIDTSSWTIPSISTITITGGGSGYTGATGSYTMNGGYTIGSIDSTIWNNGKEFVDCLPSFSRIEAMCKEYPGLAIAFEKFKTTYYLVKDEYDNPKDKK